MPDNIQDPAILQLSQMPQTVCPIFRPSQGVRTRDAMFTITRTPPPPGRAVVYEHLVTIQGLPVYSEALALEPGQGQYAQHLMSPDFLLLPSSPEL